MAPPRIPNLRELPGSMSPPREALNLGASRDMDPGPRAEPLLSGPSVQAAGLSRAEEMLLVRGIQSSFSTSPQAFTHQPELQPLVQTFCSPRQERSWPGQEPGIPFIRRRERTPQSCPCLILAILPGAMLSGALGPDAGAPTLPPTAGSPSPSLFSRALAEASGARVAPRICVSGSTTLLL